MRDIQEWIDNSRAHADRAADHVADIAAGVERWTMKVPPTDADTDIMLIGLLDGTLGQALAALQAVLEIHQDHGGPCPTVQAIQNALKGDHDDSYALD